MRKIEVVEYNPSWPISFRSERDLLHRLLKDIAIEIHHIGSTAVPGLATKPIIDILVEVSDIAALDNLKDEMEVIGYESKGEFGIPGRRFFQKGGDNRTHHIHAFAQGDSNVMRHIAFRDFLRTNPEVSHEYGELKKQIAQECDHDIDSDCAGKDAYVKRIEMIAVRAITAQQDGEPDAFGAGDL